MVNTYDVVFVLSQFSSQCIQKWLKHWFRGRVENEPCQRQIPIYFDDDYPQITYLKLWNINGIHIPDDAGVN